MQHNDYEMKLLHEVYRTEREQTKTDSSKLGKKLQLKRKFVKK